jgi:hypothetical protein
MSFSIEGGSQSFPLPEQASASGCDSDATSALLCTTGLGSTSTVSIMLDELHLPDNDQTGGMATTAFRHA